MIKIFKNAFIAATVSGGSIHIFVFTYRKKNRFQTKLTRYNTNI